MPTMLSLTMAKTPLERALIADRIESGRERAQGLIEKLIGRVAEWKLKKWREQVSGLQFSLSSDGKVNRTSLEEILAELDATLPSKADIETGRGLRLATEEDPPEETEAAREKRKGEVGDRMARMQGKEPAKSA